MSAVLPIITHPAYILACVLIGIAGRKRRLGIVGFALLSFLLTPLLMWFLLFMTGERKRRHPTLEEELEQELES